MGRHCGFSAYKKDGDNLVKVDIFDAWEEGKKTYWLGIDGRCPATDIFLDAVYSREAKSVHSFASESEITKSDKYSAYLLLNHPELDKHEEYEKDYQTEWFSKFFYVGLKEFKKLFDFDEAERKHQELLKSIEQDISDCEKEIKELRIHQENSKTKVAFKGFQDEIASLKEKISDYKSCLEEAKEDDYDYNHYMWIKEYIELCEEKIKEDPDLIIAAWAND